MARRVGGSLHQRPPNRFHDAVDVIVQLVVPESQHAKALAGEYGVATAIVLCLSVLAVTAAIEFDDDPVSQASEVWEVATKRRLSAKVETLGSQSSKTNPQAGFVLG